jgi:hypothetical protein
MFCDIGANQMAQNIFELAQIKIDGAKGISVIE